MNSFKDWLLKLEIGQVPEPGKPEVIPTTAFPTYDMTGNDLPPTPQNNAKRLRSIMLRRMKKK